MLQELRGVANLDIPEDVSSEAANQYLRNACEKYGVNCSPPLTTARLLDKVTTLVFKHLHFSYTTCLMNSSDQNECS